MSDFFRLHLSIFLSLIRIVFFAFYSTFLSENFKLNFHFVKELSESTIYRLNLKKGDWKKSKLQAKTSAGLELQRKCFLIFIALFRFFC